ncbi:hypothetical protein [Pseudonocardia acidicola]|nr:hypothetical protein [Pseudonocardia acidicola]
MRYALVVTEAREIEIEIGPAFTDDDVDTVVAAVEAAREVLLTEA